MKVLFFFIISISIFAKKNFFWQMNNKEINNIISQISKKNNNLKKIIIYSYLFTQTPYKLDVLGEGRLKPIYSFKAVDCVTYVETVLALSNSKTLNESISLLQKIRYKNGEIKYNKRNHFTMTQWVPNNENIGIIKDVTKIVSKNIKIIRKNITKEDFKSRKFKKFLKLKDNLPLGKHEVTYIPIDYFLKNQNKMTIKSGTIMMIIRENRNRYPIFTSHLGFLINTKNGRVFRSAVTNRRFKEVRDYKLLPYLKFYEKYYKKKKWRLIGVSLFLPQDLSENK